MTCTCRPSFSRLNPDTIGRVWAGELDLNTLQVDGEIFESVKKKLWKLRKSFQYKLGYIKVFTTISSG